MNTNMGGMGVPPGVQRMQNVGTPGAMPISPAGDHKRKLHTYIYDYFLKNGQYELARMLVKEVEVETVDKPSPNRKGINGLPDGMDLDSKDDPNRPADLARANVPGEVDTPFLLDWWSQFWDCWNASRTKAPTMAKQYLDHVQASMAPDRRIGNGNQMMPGVNPRGMLPNGMPMPNDMKKAMMMQGGVRPGQPASQQQLQQYRMQQQMQQQQQLTQQTQMQREGSQMDANGQGRPQTPASGDAPSPKRQRIESGNFNGPMGPMGRGQNPGMPNAQFNGMQMQTPNGQGKPMQGMQNPGGMQQGSPAIDQGVDMFGNGNNLRAIGVQPNAGGPGGPGGTNNHALQDYQMQLMLLEQQNKKRLLMARQEQDSQGGQGGPGGPVVVAPSSFNAPAMSPSNSRAGPSPNPDEQMKRGTPKMVPGGLDLPARGSPIPGFDPSQMNPGMGPNFQGMKMQAGMMGQNGQLMAAAAHPAFSAQMNGQMNGQMNPQQLAMMQQRANAGGAGGPWPQGPPPGMMHPGQGQPPNMTPQQRNTAMPPPPAPAAGDNQNRTQPSSPSQNAAPPTPSQANKPNPKKKDAAKGNKKAANKKGPAGMAPAETGDQPPTPTPAPPITPTAPSGQFNKSGPGQAGNMPGMMPQQDMGSGFNDPLDGTDMNFNMDFGAIDGADVLDNFDFDAFLTSDNNNDVFQFDSVGFGPDGLEAGGDV